MLRDQFPLHKISRFREIDYFQLKNALSEYANFHAKIRQLLACGQLVRVKKGLYVLGAMYNHHPITLEVLANLIYGPSAISLEFALAYYGLIPESVRTVTSITPQRDKIFNTPVGNFTYRYLSLKKYRVGLNRLRLNDGRYILIASPEKALLDKIYFSKQLAIENSQDVENFLSEDLRIDEKILTTLNINLLTEIAIIYKISSITTIVNYLKQR